MNGGSYGQVRVGGAIAVVGADSKVIGFVRRGKLIASADAKGSAAYAAAAARWAVECALPARDFYRALNKAVA